MRFTAPGFEPGPFANSGIHPFLWSRLKHSQLRSPSYKDGALLLSQGGFKLLAEQAGLAPAEDLATPQRLSKPRSYGFLSTAPILN